MENSQNIGRSTQFLLLSVIYWATVVIATYAWSPIYRLMADFITMYSEYSLLEQGTKFLLLLMMIFSLIAYRNEEDRARIQLSIAFLMFALAMYLGESNFLEGKWQPLFGAVFILAILWLLLRIDLLAMLLMFGGCVGIAMGMLGDVWYEHPDVIRGLPQLFNLGQFVYSIEEYLDLWGVAFFAYSCLFVFRNIVTGFFAGNRSAFAVLVVSAGLVASGNSFVHWQYSHGQGMSAIATFMAIVGLAGVVFASEKLLVGRMQFGFFHANILFRNGILLFVVLPLIFGGVDGWLNLFLWSPFFAASIYYLKKSNPAL